MGIGDIFKRRRERESALSPDALESFEGESESRRADALESFDGESESRRADEAGSEGGDASGRLAGAGEEANGDERSPTELPGADASELGAMLRRAAATGLPQVSVERHEVDVSGGDLAEEMLSILAGFGIAGGDAARELHPTEARQLNEQVREALRRAGIDPDSGETL